MAIRTFGKDTIPDVFLLFRIIDKIGRLQYQKSFLRYSRQNSTVPIDIVFELLYNVCKEVLKQFRKK